MNLGCKQKKSYDLKLASNKKFQKNPHFNGYF